MSTVISRNNSVRDRVFLYPEYVSDGRIIAGPHVRSTCVRFGHILSDPAYRFSEERAAHIVNFIETQVYHSTGEDAGKPFLLNDWETFALGWIFGILKVADGLRLVARAYIETAKGSGKTPLASAVSIYMTGFDGESRAESYVIAKTGEQAKIPMSEILAQIGANKALSTRFHVVGGSAMNKAYFKSDGFRGRGSRDPFLSTRSRIERIGSDNLGAGKSGYKTHFLLTDEYHEHSSAYTHDFMAYGFKNRRQPLDLMITNSGEDFVSPCGQEHLLAIKVANEEVDYPEYFSFVCALDEGDDPWEDESCWPKTNPSLPEIPGYRYVRSQVSEAKANESKRAIIGRLNFCIWGHGETTWIHISQWEFKDIENESLTSYPCYMALDLARRSDLCAAALVWKLKENLYYGRVTAWMPGDNLKRRSEMEGVPWETFRDKGFITVTPGRVVNFKVVADWILDVMMGFNLVGMAYDPWRIEDLKADLEDLGMQCTDLPVLTDARSLWLISHSQGFYRPKAGERTLWMPGSIDVVEDWVSRKVLVCSNSPILRYAINGVKIMADEALNRKFLKAKSASKIDPLVSLTMACGFAKQGAEGFMFGSPAQMRQKALLDLYRDGVPDGLVGRIEGVV